MNRFKVLILSVVLLVAPIVSQANEKFADIIESVSAAVVAVTVEANSPSAQEVLEGFGDSLEEFGFPPGFLDNLMPNDDEEEPVELSPTHMFGTGFLIDDYIVTNYHVIEDGYKIVINFQNNPQRYEVEVINSDKIADIAILKVINPLPFDVTPLEWSDQVLRSGQDVWAIGHPRGKYFSVSKGIISHINRAASNNWQKSIQTDVAINPGNSGGPLLDMDGKVIAINTVIVSAGGGSDGISISVEGKYAQNIIERLLTGEEIDRPLMGLQIATNVMTGETFVTVAVEGKPGKAAGVMSEDIFYELDNIRINVSQDVFEVLRVHQPGDTITGIFLRGEEREPVVVDITLMSMNSILTERMKSTE